jgi:two-component system, OmpR family, alkaline phosphatase synthesis response regulator PhoP
MTDFARILIVDDEDHIREVAQLSLEAVGGHEVLSASSGIEAIEQATNERPDAILLDVMMPELDGPGTLDRLRSNPATQDIPVVFLTAKVRESDVERFRDLDVAGVLAKPFDPMTLPEQLRRVLQGEG